MSFNGNTLPKKAGKGAKVQQPWDCACPRRQPKYLLRCPRCGKGRP